MFGKNTAPNNATTAKLVAADKERESIGVGKWQSGRASKANDDDIDAYYQNLDDAVDERDEQVANLRRYNEDCLQLTAFAPNYDFNATRLKIL